MLLQQNLTDTSTELHEILLLSSPKLHRYTNLTAQLFYLFRTDTSNNIHSSSNFSAL